MPNTLKILKYISELNTSNKLSQCYDGASVMSGKKGSVMKLISDRLGGLVPYMHCFNNQLYLIIDIVW